VAAQGASTAFASRVVGAGLGLVVQLLLARWAGPSVYGTYSYAVAWVATLATGVGLGLPQAALRFIPTYEVSREWALLRGLYRRGQQVTLLGSLSISLLGSAVLLLSADPLSEGTARAVLIGLWALPLAALVEFHTQSCRAVDRLVGAYIAPLLRSALMIVGIVTLSIGLDQSLNGSLAVALFGASLLPIVWVQRRSFRRYVSRRDGSETAARFDTRRWLSVAAPLLLVAGFSILLQRLDLLLVGWMLDMKAAGLYQAAISVAAPASFVLGAVNAVAAPRFARLHSEDDLPSFRAFVRQIAHWLFWPTIALSALLGVGASFFLGLFGEAFREAQGPLLLLVLSHIGNASFGSVAYLLNMTGHHADTARVYGLSIGVNIGLTILGIHLFGLLGAAAATALSTFVWNAWLHRIVQRRLGLSSSIYSALWNR